MKYAKRHICEKLIFATSVMLVAFLLLSEIFLSKTVSQDTSWKIAFVLDVSKSMNVKDMDSQSRLYTAKNYIENIIREHPHLEYSLNIFAWDFQRVLPYTSDRELFFTFLSSLNYKNVTRQWSDISLAISELSSAHNLQEDGLIIFITDGSEESIKISDEVKNMYSESRKAVYILWVWTPRWGFIPTGNIARSFEIFNWQRVVSRLNDSWLQDIAKQLSATYIDMDDTIDFSRFKQKKQVTHVSVYVLCLIWLIYISVILWKWHYNPSNTYE